MKKVMTKGFSLVLALMMLITCFAGFGTEAFAASVKTKKIDGVTYSYTISKNKATVQAIDPAKKTTVSIPSKLGGKAVTTVNSYALGWNDTVKTVKIPNSVTKLCYSAFSGCEKLSTINIGTGLKTIEKDAFSWCSGITKFTVDKNNKNFTTSNGSLYNKKKTKIVKYTTGKKTKEVTLPKSVTSIGYAAFAYADNVEKITIPSAVTTISSDAFYGCSSLKTAKIPSKVKTIGTRAYCATAVKSITVPKTVTSIGYGAFSCCDKLTSVDLSKANITSISDELFSWSNKLSTIKIPSKVTKIGEDAFAGTAIKSFTASKNISSIGFGAFSWCESLTTVDLSKSKITKVASCLFSLAQNLSTVKLPSSVKSIESYAFEECMKLGSITLPSKLEKIKGHAFNYCPAMTKITIPASVTNVYANAFYESGITQATFKGKNTKISSSAFSGCDLTTVKGPKNSTAQAFAEKKELKFVAI